MAGNELKNCQSKTGDSVENCQPKLVKCGCGGEAKIDKHTYYRALPTYGVRCHRCGQQTRQFYNTESEAITAWNRAMGERTAKATRKPEAFFYRCECGYGLCCEKNDMNYCPSCGARLEWK